jgi:hypothetical protein
MGANVRKRGSELLRALHGDQHGLNQASLGLIDDVLSNETIQLLGWQRRGVPVIDGVVGTFLAPRGGVADLVRNLGSDEVAWGIEVFPYGIPAVEFLTVVQVTRDVAGKVAQAAP